MSVAKPAHAYILDLLRRAPGWCLCRRCGWLWRPTSPRGRMLRAESAGAPRNAESLAWRVRAETEIAALTPREPGPLKPRTGAAPLPLRCPQCYAYAWWRPAKRSVRPTGLEVRREWRPMLRDRMREVVAAALPTLRGVARESVAAFLAKFLS